MKRRSLLCAAICLPALAHHERVQHAYRDGRGWPLAPFRLHDHVGAPLTLERLHGRWSFVLLGDLRCAQPCTDALEALAGLRQRIAGTQALQTTQVIFVSLAPAHDTPARLRSHLARYDTNFIGATGPPAMLRQLVDDLALASDDRVDPRGALVLVGPDAVVRVQYLPPYDVKLLTADYLITRARR